MFLERNGGTNKYVFAVCKTEDGVLLGFQPGGAKADVRPHSLKTQLRAALAGALLPPVAASAFELGSSQTGVWQEQSEPHATALPLWCWWRRDG